MNNRLSTVLGIALVLFAGHGLIYARGEHPPPPPFMGGNVGAWLGSGPIFGFDDGGGPGGGWGGGWYGGADGWGGLGSGSGGSGGYSGGSHGTGGSGHLFDTTKKDGFGGLHGTCWSELPIGSAYRCHCDVKYNPLLPPCHGCPVHGFCIKSPVWDSEMDHGSCNNYYEVCSGYFP